MRCCLDVAKFSECIQELPEEPVYTFREEKKLLKELGRYTGKKGLGAFNVYELLALMDMTEISDEKEKKDLIERRIYALLECPDVSEPKLM